MPLAAVEVLVGRIVRTVVGIFGGYLVGAVTGLGLVSLLSSNTHDSSVESVTISAFVTGPAGALVGLIAGLLIGRKGA